MKKVLFVIAPRMACVLLGAAGLAATVGGGAVSAVLAVNRSRSCILKDDR